MCRCVIGAQHWSTAGWRGWRVHTVWRRERRGWCLVTAVVGLDGRRKRSRRRHWNARLGWRWKISLVAWWQRYIGQWASAWVLLTVVAAVVPVGMVASPAFIRSVAVGAASLAEGSGARSAGALHNGLVGVPKWASRIEPWMDRCSSRLLLKNLLLRHGRGHAHHVCRVVQW